MALDWFDTLRILLPQFEARAAKSPGLNHLLVEVADHERAKISGPPWFAPGFGQARVVDGKLQFRQWDASAMKGLPLVHPSYREVRSDEKFDENDEHVIRDRSGVVRAVAVPMRLRQGYFCGQPAEDVSAFEALANAAARALMGSENLQKHVFGSDLSEIFRKPRGGVRYVFGEVASAPNRFMAMGWDAGVVQFDHGVVIDVPVAESAADSGHWLLLLHRLAWRRVEGSALIAERNAWDGNTEVAMDLLAQDWARYPREWSAPFGRISRESFYSILGTKTAPLDVNLASVFAIQLLLSELSTKARSAEKSAEPAVDYSNEDWHKRAIPPLRTIKYEDCKGTFKPQAGILVATDVERLAVLKRLRPPKGKRSVLQVYAGSNTGFLGRLGLTDIVLCMTSMGSSGRDASTIVTAEIIQLWNLSAVIMVGIAFGKDPVKQRIGNVLVADRIISYEPQRVGQDHNQHRGSEHAARPVLLNRFRNVVGWSFQDPAGQECGMQIGPLLSGEKLIDNLQFRDELFASYPVAIGGEMEGVGLASSAERVGCEWIVVKAICDWGDGAKSNHHQGFAAAAAVDLVEHVLNQAGVLDAVS